MLLLICSLLFLVYSWDFASDFPFGFEIYPPRRTSLPAGSKFGSCDLVPGSFRLYFPSDFGFPSSDFKSH